MAWIWSIVYCFWVSSWSIAVCNLLYGSYFRPIIDRNVFAWRVGMLSLRSRSAAVCSRQFIANFIDHSRFASLAICSGFSIFGTGIGIFSSPASASAVGKLVAPWPCWLGCRVRLFRWWGTLGSVGTVFWDKLRATPPCPAPAAAAYLPVSFCFPLLKRLLMLKPMDLLFLCRFGFCAYGFVLNWLAVANYSLWIPLPAPAMETAELDLAALSWTGWLA